MTIMLISSSDRIIIGINFNVHLSKVALHGLCK